MFQIAFKQMKFKILNLIILIAKTIVRTDIIIIIFLSILEINTFCEFKIRNFVL